MSKKKVSVIIPVYNAERYLQNCINSVINQSFKDWEAVLVNDGSTDQSEAICLMNAANDSRIRVITQANRGAGVARKTGVEAAEAELLCFLDSDDYWQADFLEKMISVQARTQADLVECAYYVVNGVTKKIHSFLDKDCILNREEFKNQVILDTIICGAESVVLWNKLYRSADFKKKVIQYGENILEDYLINMQYYIDVQCYCYIIEPLTNYRMTPLSLSRRHKNDLYNCLRDNIIPFKKNFMKYCQMDDLRCQKLHAGWYVNYVENYLLMEVCSKRFYEDVLLVLNDVEMRKASSLISGNKFAKMIDSSKDNRAFIYLYVKGLFFYVKRRLYRLKHKIKRRFG